MKRRLSATLMSQALVVALEAVIVITVVLVFAELFAQDRVFDSGDDKANYVENVLLQTVPVGGHWRRILDIWRAESVIGVSEPIALLLKLVLAETFGMRARTFVGAGVVCHAAACVFAARVAAQGHRLLDAASGAHERVSMAHAATAALLVGLHPLRVEPLAWASALPYHFSALFALWACGCHLRHRAGRLSPLPVPSPFGLWRLLSALCLVLSCSCKAAALGLGPFLVLADAVVVWEAAREVRTVRWALRALACILLDSASLVVASALSAHGALMASKGPGLHNSIALASFAKVLRASYMAALYIVQQLLPLDLCVLHAVPAEDVVPWDWRFGGALLLVVCASIAAPRFGARRAFAWFGYLALLLPTLGLVSEHVAELAADRYCHLACMVLGVPALAGGISSVAPRPGPLWVAGAAGAAAVEVAASREYLRFWRTPFATIEHSVRASPRFFRTRYIHGMDLWRAKRLPEAEAQLREAMRLNPFFVTSHFGLAQVLVSSGKAEEAIGAMRASLEHDPRMEYMRFNLASALARAGRLEEAVVEFEEVLRDAPQDADARRGLASAKRALGARARAEVYLSIVVATRNDDYAGRLEERLAAHVSLMHFQLSRACFSDAELLVVEWNPVVGRAPIRDLVLGALGEADAACAPSVRVLRVDSAVHAALVGEGLLGKGPMAEYHAKNLGIRRARGRFVACSNLDVVYSPALVRFLAMRGLREDSFYNAGLRFDTEWPQKPDDVGAYLQKLLQRASNDDLVVGTPYEKSLGNRPETSEQARRLFGSVCKAGDSGEGRMPGYWDFQAGDFVLAARSRWEEVLAYPELPWTFAVDSSILCKFFGRGLRNVVLLPPCVVVHQHHRIREHQQAFNGFGDSDTLCDAMKRDPSLRAHKSQRDPELWGLWNDSVVEVSDVVLQR